MSENMSDVIKNLSSMMQNGNIPDNMKEMLNNFASNSKSTTASNTNSNTNTNSDSNLHSSSNPNSTTNNNSTNDIFSNINPEMIQKLSGLFSNATSANKDTTNSNTGFDLGGIDMNMILKMKSIMDKMNTKEDPRSNLLLSLKPYLKDSRKSKVDQYIKLLNMGKVMDVFNPNGGEKSK